jgi:hypothetical protein
MFVLFALIFIGYIIYNTPSKEEAERMKRQQDSIAVVQKQKHITDSLQMLPQAMTQSKKKNQSALRLLLKQFQGYDNKR